VLGEQFKVVDPGTGREATILAKSAPVHDANGAVEGAITLLQDITPLKEQERLRQERLAEAAHDLRNHLTTVLSTTQILQSHVNRHATVDGALLARGLTLIVSGVQRVDTQVDVILNIAHERGEERAELQRAAVDLVQVVREVVAEFEVPDSMHTIQLAALADSAIGCFDEACLRTVLWNLLGNSIKFSPQGGAIQVHLERDQRDEGEWLLLRVIDTGLGIPAGDLPHVFERFYRASNASGQIPGTGLGLSGVQRIVEQHGGTVCIDSTEGYGTTVDIRLPIGAECDRAVALPDK
jgi:signal transduction histidine kinase